VPSVGRIAVRGCVKDPGRTATSDYGAGVPVRCRLKEATVIGDIYAMVLSSAMLRGALGAMSDDTGIAYFAGRGLLVSGECVGDVDLPAVVADVRALVVGLSGTVRGLAPDETVTVAWLGGSSGGPQWHQIVAEMRPGDLASLAVNVDGRVEDPPAVPDAATRADGRWRMDAMVGPDGDDPLLASAALLRGGVAGVADRVKTTYVVGEGLLIRATWLGRIDLDQTQWDFAALLRGLGHRIVGLSAGESITIEWVGRRSGESVVQRVVARMRPGDEASVEVSAVEEAWDD